jgi:tetratricopeptide (TPR) repeat protein
VPAPRREAAALLILLLPALGACGLLSRQRDAYIELHGIMQLQDPVARRDALAELRGAEPMIPAIWLASAEAAGSPEAALPLIEQGLQFRPQSPDLLVARLSLLGQLDRRDDQIAAVHAVFAADAPTELRAEALWFQIDALLAQDRAPEAEAAAQRLCGLPFARPEMASAAWARIAMAYELGGDAADADRTLDASLDLGAPGLMILRRESLEGRDQQAAADVLVQRAVARHPDDPDLQLYLLVDRMSAGDLAGAAAALDELPVPLPERLVGQREALRARILLLQDRTEDGLGVLRGRLTEEPGDAYALGVLLEAWHVRHVPEADEVMYWLRASRGKVFDPALAAQIEATLRQLAQEAGPDI